MIGPYNIKLVHLLSLPHTEREIRSVRCMSRVSCYGIDYVQHINAPFAGDPPKETCQRPDDISPEPGFMKLSKGHYGCYRAFRDAIEKEFTEDTDFLIICEADCVLECSLTDFSERMQQIMPLMEKHEIGCFSFGDKIHLFGDDEVSNKVSDIPDCDNAFITNGIFGLQCIMFARSARPYLLAALRVEPWDAFDLFLNRVCEKYWIKMGIVSERMAIQAEGLSLIDNIHKKTTDDKTSEDNPLRMTRYGDAMCDDVVRRVYREHLYEKMFPVENGDIVVDVGAHVGAFSLGLKNTPSACYCIEPDAKNFHDLQANIHRLGKGRNIILVNKAIDRDSSFAYFNISDDMGVSGRADGDTGEQLPTVSFQDFLSEWKIDHIDFLKLDCEGGEHFILGAKENWDFIRTKVKKIVGELHVRRSGFSLEDSVSILENLKYWGFDLHIFSVDDIDITKGFFRNPGYYTEVLFYARKKEDGRQDPIDTLLGFYKFLPKSEKAPKSPQEPTSIHCHFVDGPFLEIRGSNPHTSYDVEFIDSNTGEFVYGQSITANHWVRASRKWHTDWQINVKTNGAPVFDHRLNLTGKRVLIGLDSNSLGDTLAWFPYAEEFRKTHDCKVLVATFWNYLFKNEYPDLEFVEPGSSVSNLYASYKVGWYSPPGNNHGNPSDYRLGPLQKTASDVLGLPYKEVRPKITIPDRPRAIKGKYVCIGIHGTALCKYWNNPNGWQEVVDYLNGEGYKVALIHREEHGYMGVNSPKHVIDKTGNAPIQDRIIDLKYADMFIGIGSGLSWLAWAVGTPVVMISGFSAPWCEFQSNVKRIHSYQVCNSCFNDPSIVFDRGDWRWCPRNRDFECSKSITSAEVIKAIEQLRA